MATLIGTDEAGYGPNLGPLVVTATVWEVPDQLTHHKLYSALQHILTSARGPSTDTRLWIADSKQVYKSSGSLAPLERGVLSATSAVNHSEVRSWRRLWEELSGEPLERLESLPWYATYDETLPIDAPPQDVEAATDRLVSGLAQANIRLRGIFSRTVFAGQFNQLLSQYGNKSSVLSCVTLDLIQRQLARNADGPICVLCDKHGGRNRYGKLLQERMTESLVEIRRESRDCSEYRWGPPERRIEFRFQAKADNVLAAALASMVSKYLRELAMRAFNRFWCARQTDLKPTAGYPTDARRFRKQIAAVQAGLGIRDHLLWRQR